MGHPFVEHSPIFAANSFETLRKGLTCESCLRFVKLAKKTLNYTVMQHLDLLYDHALKTTDDYLPASRMRIKAATHTEDIPTTQTGDYRILVLWGFAEEHPEKKGYVRITLDGIDFREGRKLAPYAIWVENYRQRYIGPVIDTPDISYAQACDKHWHIATT